MIITMEMNGVASHEVEFIDEDGVVQSTRVPVVQELACQRLDYLPQMFIQDNPQIAPSSVPQAISTAIPAIDMAKIQSGSKSELAKLATAAKDWGFFLITNHGIESPVLDTVKKVVKGFFSLSFGEKKASVGTYKSVDNVGYGRNFVKSPNQPLDWIDRLTMKAAPKEATHGLRVWPQNPADFRQAVETYVEKGRNVCKVLLEALAEVLSLERLVFTQFFDPNESEINVRVNYYPPCPRPDLAVGITSHSDASAVTLLIQFDASGGLQVFKDTKWFTVEWPCDALLVNFGDLMEIMSNGCFKSPWHRAVTQRDVERFSVALFYNPPSKAEIKPIEKGTTRYKKVVVGEYLQHYYKISPTVTKEAITFAQL